MNITKHDKQMRSSLAKASFLSSLVDEKTDTNLQVECFIREKYSISQEIMLHRKKLMGTLSDEEWNEYVSYVEECIARAEEEPSGGDA